MSDDEYRKTMGRIERNFRIIGWLWVVIGVLWVVIIALWTVRLLHK